MSLKKILLGLPIFLTFAVSAQTEYKNQEYTLANDNDVYLLLGNDRYYSNGMFFRARWAPEKTKFNHDSLKTIFEVEVAQKFFTPQDLNLLDVNNFERPYAGLLYAGFNLSKFKDENTRWMYGAEFGITGRESGAEGFQRWYHDAFGFPKPRGWQYQIPHEFVFNFRGEYNKQKFIVPDRLDAIWSTEVSVGTAFTHIYQRLDLRIGELLPLNKSPFKNAIIGAGSERFKLNNYWFFGLGLQFVAHNLTIEGSVWNNDAPHTETLNRLVRHFRLGWAISSYRSTFKIALNGLTKEIKDTRNHGYIGWEFTLRFPPKNQR